MTGDSGRSEPADQEFAEIRRVAMRTALASGAAWHEADEVAQVTAVKLWRVWQHANVDAARRRGRARWQAYVRTVAVNVHRDLIRAHLRRVDRQNRAAGGREVSMNPRPGAEPVVPTSPDGIDAYLGRAFIIDEIRRLAFKQRTVAELVFVDEMSIREIAQHLGIQPQSVRKHLRSARETLRRRLTESERQVL